MSGYECFADYYDELTANVEYRKIAEYILKILGINNHNPGKVVDLACGTGSLTLELAQMGVDVIGVDSSCDMLSVARNKALEYDNNIFFICQRMQDLELGEQVDTIICTLDSINHLEKKEDVQKTFEKVSKNLKKGAYFIFDVNTIYKHDFILANNTFVYETERVFCVWQNSLDEKNHRVFINLDFFEKKDGVYFRNSEEFFENAYREEEIEHMLKKANLEIIDKYDDMTFGSSVEKSERIFYVTRKIENF